MVWEGMTRTNPITLLGRLGEGATSQAWWGGWQWENQGGLPGSGASLSLGARSGRKPKRVDETPKAFLAEGGAYGKAQEQGQTKAQLTHQPC